MSQDNILIKEEDFHDKWAGAMNIDEILVDEFFEACTAPENRLILSRLGDIKGKKILELGSGAGEGAVYFAKQGAAATATDISAGMLRVAEKLAQKHNVKIDTKQCISTALPFEDGTFDVVYAANLLHHVDIEATLKEARRVLKKGGTFVSWDPLIYNPAINYYRKIATKVRTEDEHPLRMKDIDAAKRVFSKVRTEFTWFLTLLIFVKYFFIDRIKPNSERYWKKIIVEHEKLSGLYNRLEKADKILLDVLPFMKRFCWNVVIIGTK